MAKQIPLPKPYHVPSNWCWIDMGKVVCMKSGFPFDSNRFSPKLVGKRPLIRIRDVLRGETATYTDEDCPEEYVIHAGEILIGMDGDFNVAKWKSTDALLNQRVCCIASGSKLLLDDFLYYYLPDLLKKINDATPSVTVKHLSTKTLNQTPIPLPPLAEQQRIVSRIESLFEKLNEAKEKAQAMIESFEDRKEAVLHKALIGELTREWRKKHGISIDEWKFLTLNDIADYKKGPFGSSITKAMFVPKESSTYKVYEQGNAIRKTLDYGHYYISQEKYDELRSFSVKPGDIIISCAGTIGEAFILPINCEPGVINQALMRVRIKENIHENYFLYYFAGIIKSNVNDEANGTAIKNIPPFKVMKAMEIRLPSLDEQVEIVNILDHLFSKERQAKASAEAVVEQIEIMKHAILVRAFRGELGTNDPVEESAVELLKSTL